MIISVNVWSWEHAQTSFVAFEVERIEMPNIAQLLTAPPFHSRYYSKSLGGLDPRFLERFYPQLNTRLFEEGLENVCAFFPIYAQDALVAGTILCRKIYATFPHYSDTVRWCRSTLRQDRCAMSAMSSWIVDERFTQE